MNIGQDGIYMRYTWYIPYIYWKSWFQIIEPQQREERPRWTTRTRIPLTRLPAPRPLDLRQQPRGPRRRHRGQFRSPSIRREWRRGEPLGFRADTSVSLCQVPKPPLLRPPAPDLPARLPLNPRVTAAGRQREWSSWRCWRAIPPPPAPPGGWIPALRRRRRGRASPRRCRVDLGEAAWV